jgi:predicted glutamine amidotransferase
VGPCSTNLWFVERRHPFAHAQLADEDLSVDFASQTTPTDRVAVVVTTAADHQRSLDGFQAR